MALTAQVKKIIDCYENENAGVKGNLVRMLNTGKLAGTGKMVILPVDQGFEHGPARSFAKTLPVTTRTIIINWRSIPAVTHTPRLWVPYKLEPIHLPVRFRQF